MNKATKRRPPTKKKDQARCPRTFNGSILDVATCAVRLGISEKTIRARIRRGLLPFRRYGGRVVFIGREIEEFLARLPGINLEEALRNMAARRGGQG